MAKRPSAARYKGMKRRPNNVLNDSRSLLRGECEPLREPDRPDDRPERGSVPTDEKPDRHGPSPFRMGRGEHEKGELTTA